MLIFLFLVVPCMKEGIAIEINQISLPCCPLHDFLLLHNVDRSFVQSQSQIEFSQNLSDFLKCHFEVKSNMLLLLVMWWQLETILSRVF